MRPLTTALSEDGLQLPTGPGRSGIVSAATVRAPHVESAQAVLTRAHFTPADKRVKLAARVQGRISSVTTELMRRSLRAIRSFAGHCTADSTWPAARG